MTHRFFVVYSTATRSPRLALEISFPGYSPAEAADAHDFIMYMSGMSR
jgi:hypothetical protein